MSWHGVQSGSSIGAHAGMAAKVLRALAAVLVGGPAKGVNLKELIVGHTDKLSKIQARRDIRRTTARVPKVERTDGEGSILIDFCSFARRRVTRPTA